jgi:hypothetical protein
MSKDKRQIAKRFKPRIETAIEEADKITSPWRIFKIMGEFVSGFEFLKSYDAAVTFFGSARLDAREKYYKEATKLGKYMAEMGFAVITGGGPGIMEAGNKGAAQAGGVSIGINIQLPHEQRVNKYVKQSQAFHYFFTRKVMLIYASELYVYFPGGYGTLDEFFELVTLVQTRKICQVPIILIGREFWTPLLDWLDKTLNKQYKTIGPQDNKIYHLVDNADEALAHINKLIKENKISTKEVPIEYSHESKIQL